jgi:hypothetical protein
MEQLHFDPVPSRTRHDGWSADDQREFIRRLARGHSVDEAAKSLGHSRQSAYALRRRADAEGFAQAWDAAQALGRAVWQAKRCAPTANLTYAFETLLVPRFYRGRLIGFVQRKDNAAAVRALAELDRHLDDQRILSKLTR